MTERSSYGQSSPGWFLSLLFLLMLSGPPKFRQRDVLAVVDQPVDFAAGVEIAVWLLGAALVFWLFTRRAAKDHDTKVYHFLPSSMRWFLVYALIAGLSSFYSLFPPLSAYRAFQLVVATYLIAALYGGKAGSFDLHEGLRLVYILSVLLILLQAVMYMINPYLVGSDYATGYRFHGGTTSDYGTSALVLGILFLSNALTRPEQFKRALNWILYIGTWMLILLTKTRITMISGVAIFLLVVLLIKGMSIRSILFLTLPVLAIIFLNVQSPVEQVLLREGEGLQTWSGRLPVWEYLWDEFLKSPLFGYGFLAGSRMILPYFPETLASAHSALFEALVGVGLVGLAPLVISLILGWKEGLLALRFTHWKRLRTYRPYVHVVQAFAILVFITISGITGTGIAGNASGNVMMFLVVIGGFNQVKLNWENGQGITLSTARHVA